MLLSSTTEVVIKIKASEPKSNQVSWIEFLNTVPIPVPGDRAVKIPISVQVPWFSCFLCKQYIKKVTNFAQKGPKTSKSLLCLTCSASSTIKRPISELEFQRMFFIENDNEVDCNSQDCQQKLPDRVPEWLSSKLISVMIYSQKQDHINLDLLFTFSLYRQQNHGSEMLSYLEKQSFILNLNSIKLFVSDIKSWQLVSFYLKRRFTIDLSYDPNVISTIDGIPMILTSAKNISFEFSLSKERGMKMLVRNIIELSQSFMIFLVWNYFYLLKESQRPQLLSDSPMASMYRDLLIHNQTITSLCLSRVKRLRSNSQSIVSNIGPTMKRIIDSVIYWSDSKSYPKLREQFTQYIIQQSLSNKNKTSWWSDDTCLLILNDIEDEDEYDDENEDDNEVYDDKSIALSEKGYEIFKQIKKRVLIREEHQSNKYKRLRQELETKEAEIQEKNVEIARKNSIIQKYEKFHQNHSIANQLLLEQLERS